MNKKYKVLR